MLMCSATAYKAGGACKVHKVTYRKLKYGEKNHEDLIYRLSVEVKIGF